jgi:AmmeMemoRadiSam system protein B
VNTSIRMPAVAGRFYPANAEKLLQELEGFLPLDPSPIHALGCVAPHAGYVYSGSIAGAVYSRIAVPRCCVVLCPNHTGLGPPLSIMSSEAWQTPLGSVPIDKKLATELKTRLPSSLRIVRPIARNMRSKSNCRSLRCASLS